MQFKDFLENVKATCIDAFEHQDYPFDLLVNDLKCNKDASHSPIFDTMFLYQNNKIENIDFGGIKVSLVAPKSHTSKFDISLNVLPFEEEFTLSFEYCTKLFDKIFISNFAAHYKKILAKVIEKPDILIADINILGNNEVNRKVYRFNEIPDIPSKNVYEAEYTSATPTLSFEPKAKIDSASTYDTFTPLEKEVAGAFEKLLDTESVGIDDNFFDLGGDSLVAINLQIELLKQNLKVTYADIFANPTVRGLAGKLSSTSQPTIIHEVENEFSKYEEILSNTTNMPENIEFKDIRKYITRRGYWIFGCTYIR